MKRLADAGLAERFLIVAPKLAASETWPQEASGFGVPMLGLLRGGLEHRAHVATRLPSGSLAVVVNYEALARLKGVLLKWSPDYVVFDESHYIKSAGAKRTKAAITIANHVRYRRLLTGNPNPKNYADFFSQYKALDPSIFGTNKEVFWETYVVPHPMYPNVVRGYRNCALLQSKIFSVASRLRRDDAFDMPQVQEITEWVTLTNEQKAEYNSIGVSKSKIESFLAYQQYLSLLKTDRVVNLVDDWVSNDQKVVVFVRFHDESDRLVHNLKIQYPGTPVFLLDGRSTDRERHDLLVQFGPMAPAGRGIAVVNIAMATGISLAGAESAVIATPDFDYAHYEQSMARIWKPSGKLVYTFVRVEGTVDDYIFSILKRKQSITKAMLDHIINDPTWSFEKGESSPNGH